MIIMTNRTAWNSSPDAVKLPLLKVTLGDFIDKCSCFFSGSPALERQGRDRPDQAVLHKKGLLSTRRKNQMPVKGDVKK